MPSLVHVLSAHQSAARVAALAMVLFSCSRDARAEIRAKLDSAVDRDDYNLATTRLDAEVGQARENWDWHLRGRWFSYALDRDLVGIRPFSGSEPALELGGHWTADSWWFAGTGGVQGTVSGTDAIGILVLARAFTWDTRTLTPRCSLGRQPLALSALPLSLGMKAYLAEAGLAWRSSSWTGELVARVDWWNEMTAQGRVENPALATIPANRRMLAAVYLISQGWWLQGGLSAKAQNGQRNTLLATQITPDYAYTWYPISTPLWAWEAAVIARAVGSPLVSLQALLQIQIPVISREMRRWESVERWDWGTAAWEAKAELTWDMTQNTQVSLALVLFAKPWTNWDVAGADGYRQLSLRAGITQRI